MGKNEYDVLNGGYGLPYDSRLAISRLDSSYEEAISELWENLYHQGDIGPASYQSVPALVEAGELSLVGAIEVARHSAHNPDVPTNLVKSYQSALHRALHNVPSDQHQLKGYYVIHASVNNQPELARALELLSVEEILSEYG